MRVALCISGRLSRLLLRTSLRKLPAVTLAWETDNGQEAKERCRRDLPDLLLLDPENAGGEGAEVVRDIMGETPCAILMVARSIRENEALVFEAMGRGVLDAAPLPTATPDGAVRGEEELLDKIRTVARLLGIALQNGETREEPRQRRVMSFLPPLVAMGASTGGPKALSDVVSGLPADLGAAIVIIQHVDPGYAQGLADWLSEKSPFPVRLAREDDRPTPGTVLVAAADRHLVLTENRRLAYTPDPLDTPYRPSVDAFFNSASRNWAPTRAVAVLLTGMGKDGAQGMSRLRRAGWHTIAQDEATSVVYGMPKAARDLDAANEILALPRIARAIARALGKSAPG